MKAFGLEIRRRGDIHDLFTNVDATLRKYEIPFGSISAEVQTHAIAHSLQRMLNVESRFSICTITDCAKLCHIHISQERMATYQAIHCVGWSEMVPEFREMVVAMILDDFRIVLNPPQEVAVEIIK